MNEREGKEGQGSEGYFLYVERDHEEIKQRISSPRYYGSQNLLLSLCFVRSSCSPKGETKLCSYLA